MTNPSTLTATLTTTTTFQAIYHRLNPAKLGLCATAVLTDTTTLTVAETGQFGIFCSNVRDDNKKVHPITSVAFTVPGARVGLFSEVQAAFAGNTIIRKGNPTTGRHCILMKASKGSSERPFIPFHFSRKSLL
eukprot:3501484-Rhodomonas_salina.1